MTDGTKIMPWGKFKGKSIEEIPSGYLRWLKDNCEDDEIMKSAEDEYVFRDKWNTHFWEDR